MALTNCLRCGTALPVQGYRQGRKRKFCSKRCISRYLYWRNRTPKPQGRLGQQNKDAVRATVKATTKELAWAAGFLEGEGCFSNPGTSEKVAAVQIRRHPLNRLRRIFGGPISMRRVEYLKRKSANYNLQYSWHVTGPRARGVMLTLYQFMSPYRQQRIREALG